MARKYNGFGIAAHIDIKAGFEAYAVGYTPFKEAILKHELLYGFEISDKSATDWFTELDSNPDRKRLFRARKTHLKEDNSYNIAKIMSSDAHTLNALGKNLSGTKKLTRLKLDSLDFNSFRVAFLDANARVRIEENIPTAFPKFLGIEFEGGILNKNKINFSDNFNCLIGGRGTGKSTTLECIRAVSGNDTRGDIIDSEVWPDTIKLYYQDEAGQIIEFQKQKYNSNINFTDPTNGIQQITIESFGQGETAATIQKCGKDPEILLKFIDNFIETSPFEVKDESMRNELLTNQSLKERLKLEIDRIPSLKKAFINAKAQLATLKANKAKEIVELEESIANERTLRTDLLTNLEAHIQNITDGLNTELLKESIHSISESDIKVGKEEYKVVSVLMDGYIESIGKQSSQVVIDSSSFKTKLKEEIEKWKIKEVDIIKKIDKKRTELETKGVKLDISFIRKVTKDVSEYEAKLKALKLKETQFKELIKQRNKLLLDRKSNLDELYNERYKFIHTVNQNLKGSVVDYEVNLSIEKQNLSPNITEIIKTVMGYRTAQVPKAEFIVEKVSYFNLIKAIYKTDIKVLTGLLNSTGQQMFQNDEATDILTRLKEINILGQLERAIVKDKPFIKIKKVIIADDDSKLVVERDFSKLSMGQQQSILLTLLLYSKRNCPLIIDQPEDNLDSEFIYKTLVKNLKRIKEHRQVIIVTHNANIAMLGDSELLIPLKSTNENTSIVDRGSIDKNKTNKMACNILEGGETAFKKRQSIYNL
ncbi:TrlF family AAA-like ATPase [Flaviramulus basaltis]|uniref:TrlF family AAA-like ATPase n=1 Tax=Flaviramulus basaltis TaxID=369401 RepID=UPI00373FC819